MEAALGPVGGLGAAMAGAREGMAEAAGGRTEATAAAAARSGDPAAAIRSAGSQAAATPRQEEDRAGVADVSL